MDVLFVDTETTGLPADWEADPRKHPDAWPRIVEIGWQVRRSVCVAHRREWEPLDHAEYLVRPDGFAIPDTAVDVHGITTEIARDRGYPIAAVMRRFVAVALAADLVVAHNVRFDRGVITAELSRLCGMSDTRSVMWQCTMAETTEFCGLPGRRPGEYKWPRLGELAERLGIVVEEAHRVAGDVETLARCWIELDRLGFWDVEA